MLIYGGWAKIRTIIVVLDLTDFRFFDGCGSYGCHSLKPWFARSMNVATVMIERNILRILLHSADSYLLAQTTTMQLFLKPQQYTYTYACYVIEKVIEDMAIWIHLHIVMSIARDKCDYSAHTLRTCTPVHCLLCTEA